MALQVADEKRSKINNITHQITQVPTISKKLLLLANKSKII